MSEEMSTAQMIEKYIALRDKADEIKKANEERLEPIREAMTWLEGKLLDSLNQAGVDSMKGQGGTVYKSTLTSASVKDWPSTLKFIQENEAWDLLEARVSKLAVLAVIQETGNPVPGVALSSATALRVRRS